MNIFSGIHPLGIGTNRLPVKNADDTEGIERSAEIIKNALDAGASYIDVSYSYSRGLAETACKLAFKMTDAPKNITVKSSFTVDKTSDDALKRVESSFKNMDIDHASYFVVWNIDSIKTFEEIMRSGSLYDGALRAKEQGLIDHICFSSHAVPDDIIKMIESGFFDAATISFSAANSTMMLPVLECAEKNNTGIVVMNPLAGGIIPQNEEYFGFLKNDEENSAAQSALRYVNAFRAINVVLSGLSSQRELEENLEALTSRSAESDKDRIERVHADMKRLSGFCTGCRYCDGCPAGIPIHSFMRAHNASLFDATPAYNRKDPELLKRIQMFRTLFLDFKIIPEAAENPCLHCGLCEKKCTQHLEIQRTLDEMFGAAEKVCFSVSAQKQRLADLLYNKRYKKAAFYPGAGYSFEVLKKYKEWFGEPEFELSFFDSNPKLWGTVSGGINIYSPDDILKIAPEIILVTNFIYSEEIFNNISHYRENGIKIEKLHKADDVPWIF